MVLSSRADTRMEALAQAIAREWARARAAIDAGLEEVAGASSEAGLAEVALYIARGGKRFRGFLVILSAEALGGTLEDALDAAIAIELVHSASLALDDTIDGDVVRRGRRVAWLVYGLPKTILTSLLMIPVAQRMVEKYGFKAIMEVTRTWEATVRGEIIDVFLADKVPARDYERLALLKTGSLFRLAGVLGALAAGVREAEEPLARYGEKLGLAYQLADDIVDYEKYRRGLRSKLDPSERLYLRWARETLGAQGEEEVTQLALERLASIVREASGSLDGLPDNEKARILRELGLHAVTSLDFYRREGRVDAVMELVGGPTINESMRSLRPGGTLVLVGNITGEPIVIRRPALLVMREISIRGSAAYTPEEWLEAIRIVAEGRVKPFYRAYPLEEVNEAYRDALEGGRIGRVILRP